MKWEGRHDSVNNGGDGAIDYLIGERKLRIVTDGLSDNFRDKVAIFYDEFGNGADRPANTTYIGFCTRSVDPATAIVIK